jgi:hypothetical protein
MHTDTVAQRTATCCLSEVKARPAHAGSRFNARVKCGGGGPLRSAGKRCRAASRGKTCMHVGGYLVDETGWKWQNLTLRCGFGSWGAGEGRRRQAILTVSPFTAERRI